jgi:glutamate--cysteine ligase
MTGIAPQFLLARGVERADSPIHSREELVAFIAAGEKADGRQQIGVELERLPLLPDGTAAPYEATDGSGRCVRAVLETLADRFGFERVMRRGRLIGLRGAAAAVSLEPGAQIELSVDPRTTAHEILDDLLAWRHQLMLARVDTGVSVVALGLQPLTPVRDIGWIPRERYAIMREHLGARGDLAHHMMKATAGVQFNVDHSSEVEAAEIFRTALAVSPIVNAMVANSPLEEGRPNGFLTKRPEIWRRTDPDRTGLLPWIFDSDGFTYSRWVKYALDVPVMFVIRDDSWVRLGDRTFGELLAHGDERTGPARHEDFALHLTTLFPEVRIKQHVEIRGQDSCDVESCAALAAAWRGILYDGSARHEAGALAQHLDASARARLHADAGRQGLMARMGSSRLDEVAGELLRIARHGLERLEGAAGRDAALLEPLERNVAEGPPAVALLSEASREGAAALLRRANA